MKTALKYLFIFMTFFIVTGAGAYFAVILVTQSAQEIILPELKGKNIIYVLETLTRMGLNTKLYGTQYHDHLPKYHVISQDPQPGTTIKKGRDVVITMSKGKKQNIIPQLKEMLLKNAVLALEDREFKVNKISRAFSNTTRKNAVMAQYPQAFKLADKGFSCDLLISLGPEPSRFIMPDLIGNSITDAVTKIESVQLELDNIDTRYSSLLPENVIRDQMPKPGTFIQNNMNVSIVVNTSHRSKQLITKDIQGVIPVKYKLDTGFLKKDVKIIATLFGHSMELYNQYTEPGKEVCVFVPAGIKTKVKIFVDDHLMKTRVIDPWNLKTYTGELLWE